MLLTHAVIIIIVIIVVYNGVARICCEEGQRWTLCHRALTVDTGTGCSSGLMQY